MKVTKIPILFLVFLGLMLSAPLFAQEVKTQEKIVVDYNNPKEYILAGVSVKGARFATEEQILAISGLAIGDKMVIPGDDIASIVKRLSMQRVFSDVDVRLDSLKRDSVYMSINLVERPRVSFWDYSGVKKTEMDELKDRLKLRAQGWEASDFLLKSSSDIIRRYYMEKGFRNVAVTYTMVDDTIIKNAVKLRFNVEKGNRVRIKKIDFIGNENVKDQKLRSAMKKTKDNHILSFFSSKKFNEKEYPNDKQLLIEKFQEKGYFDAKIVRDTVYQISDKHLKVEIEVEEGKKYYFRNITWTGNSVFSTEALNRSLMLQKGDVFDVVTLEKRLYSEPGMNVLGAYRDAGYMFCNVLHVEHTIYQDSIDVELRVFEGEQGRFNNMVINGNTITNEKVVRRQLYTKPGYLYSQTDFERSVREMASLGLFNEEKMFTGGVNPVPNQRDNTVDLVFNLEEKSSSQLEVAGGWGGNTFVGTLGVSFNNFSLGRVFQKKAWRPVPLGDGQTLAVRLQTNGTYYTALSASFIEPWLTGKKPTSLSVSAYYTRQTNATYWNRNSTDQFMEIYGFAAGIGTRLKWPDNWFVLYNELSLQRYHLKDWQYQFIFTDGTSNNLSWKINLRRNSTDAPVFPRRGSDITLGLQLTPPYSLFKSKDKDYASMSSNERYKWIEYHKWTFQGTFYTKLHEKLVLMTRAQFGYLGNYNRNLGYSPFEGYVLGGDGMSGYNTYGSEIIGMRGYKNASLTPLINGAYAGNMYDKFTMELRVPVILEPQSTIFVLAFLEGGNAWSDIRDFNPFSIKRSAGVGVRVLLPIVGMLGIDWGYGFDPVQGEKRGGGNIHFMIGQQF